MIIHLVIMNEAMPGEREGGLECGCCVNHVI